MTYISVDTAVSVCKEMLQTDANIDDVLLVLRTARFPQSLCSIILSKCSNLSAFEAKQAVVNSPVWADCFDANVYLQKEIGKVVGKEKGSESV